ncbi:hypothetical protein RHGRI_027713 [Rhododendron griersonianum]|uniref:Reticulon-like protein n=1 Tax=Rhododendron griersonianum TaxID=479676 RepID=A0AAV6J217_9ERIC|nr:hypothetical protein RHGRI_027713 [Rhododendron griersonianum]
MDDAEEDLCDGGGEGSPSTSGGSSYRLFGRQTTVHQMMGGGRAADVILWKRRHVSFGIIIVATVAWLLFERSGVSLLSICSDVLLILVVLLFIRANYAASKNKQPQTLPELVLSEEMVNNAAASFRVKINYALLVAHDITLGKDFRLFFKDTFVFFRVLYIRLGHFRNPHVHCLDMPKKFGENNFGSNGTILSITIPALYNRYQDHIDRFAGLIHQQMSHHYKIVDENVISRIPRSLSKDKES